MMLSSNLAAFDMDGTLIQGRLVFALADRFDLSDTVRSIQSHRLMAGHEQTKAIAAGFVADRLNLDFVMANKLQIFKGKITGKVDMPLAWDRIGCYCKISVCKRYHLEKSADYFCVPIENTLAVGDTKSDICMIQRAGVGIAFMPKDEEIKKASDKIVNEPDLLKVLNFVNKAF